MNRTKALEILTKIGQFEGEFREIFHNNGTLFQEFLNDEMQKVIDGKIDHPQETVRGLTIMSAYIDDHLKLKQAHREIEDVFDKMKCEDPN